MTDPRKRGWPWVWAICDYCGGEGQHSRHLEPDGGGFTSTEFAEAFDPDEAEAYFRGAYDRSCEVCGGTGKVREPDTDRMTQEQLDELAADFEYEAICAAERRLGA